MSHLEALGVGALQLLRDLLDGEGGLGGDQTELDSSGGRFTFGLFELDVNLDGSGFVHVIAVKVVYYCNTDDQKSSFIPQKTPSKRPNWRIVSSASSWRIS